jgi:hypothetical protein
MVAKVVGRFAVVPVCGDQAGPGRRKWAMLEWCSQFVSSERYSVLPVFVGGLKMPLGLCSEFQDISILPVPHGLDITAALEQ